MWLTHFRKTLQMQIPLKRAFSVPTVGYQDHVDFQGERSLSAEDVTHRLVVGHVYDLPLGRGKRFGDSWPSAADKVLAIGILGHDYFSRRFSTSNL